MKMRKLMLIAFAVILLSATAYAQNPPEIPAPDGATMITEINLSDADILGMVKAAIPAFTQAVAGTPGELGDLIKQLDIDSLSAAIEGMRQVRIMQFDMPKTTDITKTLDFYQEKLSSADGWSRIAYDVSTAPAKAGAIYTRGGQEFFAVGIDLKKSRMMVARTVGFIDIPKVAAWFGNAVKVFSDIEAKKQAEQVKSNPKQTTTTAPSTKKPATAPKPPVKK